MPIRTEVIEARRSRKAGAIVLARPASMKVAAACGAAVTLALGLLLGFSALNISRIIIAHRPETIASAQRLIALHCGQVVHDAMIAKLAGGDAAPAKSI